MLGFFESRREGRLPPGLYRLTLSAFALARLWDGGGLSGPPRGREFERLLVERCDRPEAGASEGPGSRTLNGVASASRLQHENDLVIAAGHATFHVEAKHLSGALSKNDLLIFNQKGIDYLLSDDPSVRRTPLYRILVSGSPIAPAARRFAMLWGIVVVEPDRLPLPLLHWLAGATFEFPRHLDGWRDRIWLDLPAFIAPLQARLQRAAVCIAESSELIGSGRIDAAVEQQRDFGTQVWERLDTLDGRWLEEAHSPTRAAA